MLKVRVMPCLLLDDGKLFKTINFEKPNYIGDPINAVKIFNDKEVDELIVVDISVTKENRKPDFKRITEIASECFMPLAYGGGIKSIADMKRIFALGAEKVVICSAAVENPDLISEAARIFGSQSVVISIDVRKNKDGFYEVFTQSGRKATGFDPVNWAKAVESVGAGEIFLNSIDRDGVMKGYDIPLIRKVTSAVNIPVIACGGASQVKDFAKAVKAGASAVAAGSMFVYFRNHLDGVLINFPDKAELKELF
jgi:cyclase